MSLLVVPLFLCDNLALVGASGLLITDGKQFPIHYFLGSVGFIGGDNFLGPPTPPSSFHSRINYLGLRYSRDRKEYDTYRRVADWFGSEIV